MIPNKIPTVDELADGQRAGRHCSTALTSCSRADCGCMCWAKRGHIPYAYWQEGGVDRWPYRVPMAARSLRYSVGNEHDPGDPWGRSELVIQPDGTARLDHHYSRGGWSDAWTGRVDAAALDALWAALDRAGFPAATASAPTGGATLRQLTVDVDGVAEHALIDWRATLPGYTDAFDILDGMIRQLSGDTVTYLTSQSVIVHDIARAK